jgi:thiamine kinase
VTCSPGERIAEGRTAEILAWGDGLVLKLYRDGYAADEVEQEVERVRSVVAAGVATPDAFEVVTIEGRPGVVFARVVGATMLKRLLAAPEDAAPWARLLAEEQASLHVRHTAALPALKERLARKIREADGLSNDLRKRARQMLGKLPDGDALCHGDFHPSNILLTERGPVIVDWVDAARGHPLADVVRTCVLLRFAALPPDLDPAAKEGLSRLRHAFCDTYLERYRELRPFSDAELSAWMAPVAAGRLSERLDSEEERRALIATVERNPGIA